VATTTEERDDVELDAAAGEISSYGSKLSSRSRDG
jgi:hypothetical protein